MLLLPYVYVRTGICQISVELSEVSEETDCRSNLNSQCPSTVGLPAERSPPPHAARCIGLADGDGSVKGDSVDPSTLPDPQTLRRRPSRSSGRILEAFPEEAICGPRLPASDAATRRARPPPTWTRGSRTGSFMHRPYRQSPRIQPDGSGPSSARSASISPACTNLMSRPGPLLAIHSGTALSLALLVVSGAPFFARKMRVSRKKSHQSGAEVAIEVKQGKWSEQSPPGSSGCQLHSSVHVRSTYCVRMCDQGFKAEETAEKRRCAMKLGGNQLHASKDMGGVSTRTVGPTSSRDKLHL